MRRPRKTKSGDIARIFAAVGVIAIVIAGAATAVWYSRLHNQPLADDLCPKTGAKSHTVLVVDITDPFTFTQRQAVKELISAFADGRRIGEGDLLTVFVLGERIEQNAEPIFEKCSPGDARGQSELTHSREMWRERFKSQFAEPLMLKLPSMESSMPAKYSPIMQMLQIAGLRYQHRAINGPRKLVVVSDLLQNSPELSLYREVPAYEVTKMRPEFLRLRSDLRAVQVEAHVLLHTPQLQNRRLLKFWEDFFADMGGRLTSVTSLPG